MSGAASRGCRDVVAALVVVSALCVALAVPAQAVGVLVPAASRVDMVHDLVGDVLYITNGSSIVRYHVGTGVTLPAWEVDGGAAKLKGIDLSPDGSTLAVADTRYTETSVWIWLIDVATGTMTQQVFPRAFYEGGTFTVAYGGDGSVFVTSTFLGSGWVPLRRCFPAAGSFTEVRSVRQSTMLCASADGAYIAFAEYNISSGPVGRYRVSDGALAYSGTGHFDYEIGINGNGTQCAAPTYFGTHIFDENLANIGVVGTYAAAHPIGVVYHPVEDIVYLAWATTTLVRAHDTAGFATVATYDFANTFDHPGNAAFVEGRLKLARDGSVLFGTVAGGVRVVRLYGSLQAYNQSVTTNEGTPVPVALQATIGNGGALGYSIVTPPEHGTLSGVAPNLVYTPAAGYSGSDRFTFRANYGPAASNVATVAVSVVAVNHPPDAVDDLARFARKQTVRIRVLSNDSDPDGDALTVVSVTQGLQGTVSINADGTVTYTPGKKFKGKTDRFTYTITDGEGGYDTATVTVQFGGKLH